MADPAAKIRSAEAVRLARAGMSLSAASREAGTSIPTIRRYFGPIVRRRKGRLRVAVIDEVPFTMRLSTTVGVIEAQVIGSEDRSIVGRHWNAIDRLLSTGDPDVLDPFVGLTINGLELETDPDVLVAQWRAGIHDDLDIYNQDQQAAS